jgi:hypothetical protein
MVAMVSAGMVPGIVSKNHYAGFEKGWGRVGVARNCDSLTIER